MILDDFWKVDCAEWCGMHTPSSRSSYETIFSLVLAITRDYTDENLTFVYIEQEE